MTDPAPTPPPTAKYRLTVTIDGNTPEEIEDELGYLARGGFIIYSDGYTRDDFTVYGGRLTAKLEHTNPEMTPEQYKADLEAWSAARKAARRADR